MRVQHFGDQRKEACELGEHKRLLAGVHGRFHDLCDGVQLCRVPGVVLVQKARVAAQLAQLRQLGEHLHFALVELLVVAVVLLQGQRVAQLLLVGGVQALLLGLHGDVHHRFQLVGQVLQHVGLQAAQHERCHEGAQTAGGVLVASGDVQLEVLAEAHVGSQKPGHEEVEDAPQLAQTVLHRRSGQREAVARPHALRGARRLGGVVLHVLRLVERAAVEFAPGEVLRVDAQQVVGGDQHVAAAPVAGKLAFACVSLARLGADAHALALGAHRGAHV